MIHKELQQAKDKSRPLHPVLAPPLLSLLAPAAERERQDLQNANQETSHGDASKAIEGTAGPRVENGGTAPAATKKSGTPPAG
mmetsp:Transcript_18259/g.42041  ORF Transcript_18259/g.42041 Transcript_18259/m.42041 type:complete len:83 (-) Transcript_18259:1152-1400(-)